jgi:hypothetical protein
MTLSTVTVYDRNGRSHYERLCPSAWLLRILTVLVKIAVYVSPSVHNLSKLFGLVKIPKTCDKVQGRILTWRVVQSRHRAI